MNHDGCLSMKHSKRKKKKMVKRAKKPFNLYGGGGEISCRLKNYQIIGKFDRVLIYRAFAGRKETKKKPASAQSKRKRVS